jgi:hypothetical protein
MEKAFYTDVSMGMSMRFDHYIDLSTGKLADEIIYYDVFKETIQTYVNDVTSYPDRYLMLPHISIAHIRNEFFRNNIYLFKKEDLIKYGINPDIIFSKYRVPYKNGLDEEKDYVHKLHVLFEKYDIEDDYNDFQDVYKEKLVNEWCEANNLLLLDDNSYDAIDRVKGWNKFSDAYLAYGAKKQD